MSLLSGFVVKLHKYLMKNKLKKSLYLSTYNILTTRTHKFYTSHYGDHPM